MKGLKDTLANLSRLRDRFERLQPNDAAMQDDPRRSSSSFNAVLEILQGSN
jgi:hypothetical protein